MSNGISITHGPKIPYYSVPYELNHNMANNMLTLSTDACASSHGLMHDSRGYTDRNIIIKSKLLYTVSDISSHSPQATKGPTTPSRTSWLRTSNAHSSETLNDR
ncbi:hypothetical protein Adt_41624 [Abeliophyllum distichum]|uniref:Uncharacterized protein n=1 Tax=Abeliophyllum distichum TaxID=126358 RepID=A0ABD1PQW5_9LAMI